MAIYNEKLQALLQAYEKLKAIPTARMDEEQKMAHFTKLREYSDQILQLKMEGFQRLNELIEGHQEGIVGATDKLMGLSFEDSYPTIVDGLNKGAKMLDSLMSFTF